MTLAPGSAAWLLRHELRLQWRHTNNKLISSLGVVGGLLMIHLVALPFAVTVRYARHLPEPFALTAVTAILVAIGLGMLSRGLTLLVQSMYERGDTDLLLTSPLAPTAIVSARCVAVAAGLCWEFGGFLLPAANVFALVAAQPRWLLAYAVLPVMALLFTACSLWIGLLLFRALGPRRTRLIAQIVAVALGSALLILSQLVPLILPDKAHTQLVLHVMFDPPPASAALFWPASAATGRSSIASSLALVLVLGCFVMSVRACARPFVATMVQSAGISASKKRTRAREFGRFHTGLLRVLIAKELRLLGRDPWLLTQLFQQHLYVIPMLIGAFRLSHGHDMNYGCVTFIMVCGTVSGALAWLANAGEDAPDLLRSAPLTPRAIKRAKRASALLPSVCIAPIASAILLLRQRPWSGLAVGLCCLGSALCSTLLHSRTDAGRRSRSLRDRYRQNGWIALLDFVSMFAWMGVGVIAIVWES